ncbi:hypothetical protein H0E87_028865 [Populus deltoides]|uniref:Uncharacterized protein n=1 Tax=Populus deltoides TaxID=3696 RepID=A0A8T2WXT1_POPDE|nr:hypothetical protein H0E87_028865 [Populus deltoides]
MENPFSSKEIWMGYCAWPRAQIDSVPPFDDSLRIHCWRTHSTFFQSLGILICMLDESFAEQTSAPLLDKINASETSYNGGDNVVLQETYSYFGYPSDSIDADDLGAKHSSGAGPQNCF